jgi:hypothetical protein
MDKTGHDGGGQAARTIIGSGACRDDLARRGARFLGLSLRQHDKEVLPAKLCPSCAARRFAGDEAAILGCGWRQL